MELKFKDFSPKELIGQTVLFEYGKSYNSSLNKALRKIITVTTTGFRISDKSGLFSLTDGYMKGLKSKMDMGTISRCTLITEDRANEYRAEWAKNRDIKLLKEIITEKLDKLTHEQLLKIGKIINPELLNPIEQK